jgi:hypothetical protein
MKSIVTRRKVLAGMGAAMGSAAVGASFPFRAIAESFESKRPPIGHRKFHSPVVDEYVARTKQRIGDPGLAWLFDNCFPNTLDATTEAGTFEGKPDTAVITGDIPAMWLRDSCAQVWPYVPFARREESLRNMLEGLIRRQVRCILIDPYANAFMADLNAPPLQSSPEDRADERPGVGERKWELDSLCFVIRLAYAYWKQTADMRPFDAQWKRAMSLSVATMRKQQRKHGDGPYRYLRTTNISTETVPGRGYGNPIQPIGLIASDFRPSDDACIFLFLVPSNLFAVTSLRQLAEMANAIVNDTSLANEANTLANEVSTALDQYGKVNTPQGTIWAYEVDGYGSQLLMDDAGLPSLLSLPYLASSPNAAVYARTRAFAWSNRNPYFYRGTAGEGVGGPHIGKDMVWPMAQTTYAITSNSDQEIRQMLVMLKSAAMATGFIHESYNKDNSSKFTRPWFAWANSYFGELVGGLAEKKPQLLQHV